MGIVVKFHARASGSSDAGGMAARASKVISGRFRSPASRTTSDQRRGGIPRLRHVLTVESGSPSADETAPVPPSASIVEAAVSTMAPDIIRNPRISQAFATSETISLADCAFIGPMVDGSRKEMARRLERTRLALGFKKQVEFCAEIGVATNLYNPFEKGARPLTIGCALAIRRRFNVSLDWLYCGDPTALSPALARELIREAA